jgi:hypothetical protein
MEQEQEITSKALAIPDQAKLIKVVDSASMAQADSMKSVIQAMRKEIDTFFKPMADKAFQAHRAVTGKWNEVKKPLDEADAYITMQVKVYQKLERDKAEALQREAEEKARKEAEEAKLLEAEQAEKEGHHEEAAAIIEEPIEVQVPVIKPDVPKVDQRKYRTVWKARITDKGLFMAHIAIMIVHGKKLQEEGKKAEAMAYADYLNALDINQSWLNGKARSLEKNLSMPGVQVYEE